MFSSCVCINVVLMHAVQEDEVERRTREVAQLRDEIANLSARTSVLGEMTAPLEQKLLSAQERVEAAEKAVSVCTVCTIVQAYIFAGGDDSTPGAEAALCQGAHGGC